MRGPEHLLADGEGALVQRQRLGVAAERAERFGEVVQRPSP